jgi:DNA-binding SARP family transcriptional activator
VEVRVLGPIDVVDGLRSIDVGTKMHRAVLSLLVMNANRVVSLDRLTDCLWGEEPPPTATGALHVYISGLRKVLEPGRAPRAPSRVLVTEPPGYALRLPSRFVDVARFEELLGEGQALLAAGRPAPALDLLDIGLGLWRGSPYQDLAFESFLQAEIARLTELRATAAEARAEAMLAMGRDADAVGELSEMVAEDPLRERRWGLLTLALYRSGRQAEALRAVGEARRTMGEELGLDLGPELRRLEQEILAQSPALDWRPPAAQPMTRSRRVPLRYIADAVLGLASTATPAPQAPVPVDSLLPPEECPLGYSLTAMATAVAPFIMAGSEPGHYPNTPFQILYVEDMEVEMVDDGIVATAENVFTVTTATVMYASIVSFTDHGPPMVPGFPTAPSNAAAYVFDPAHHGCQFEVDVDGTSRSIGPEYVVGPVPIVGTERSVIVTLGTFLGPFAPGAHTVTIRGGVFGRGHAETYGIASLRQTLTYTLDVVAAL